MQHKKLPVERCAQISSISFLSQVILHIQFLNNLIIENTSSQHDLLCYDALLLTCCTLFQLCTMCLNVILFLYVAINGSKWFTIFELGWCSAQLTVDGLCWLWRHSILAVYRNYIQWVQIQNGPFAAIELFNQYKFEYFGLRCQY